MVICGKEYQDVEFTAETIIRLGLAACPFLEQEFNGREMTAAEIAVFTLAYASLVMQTSSPNVLDQINTREEFGEITDQLSEIIKRSELFARKVDVKREDKESSNNKGTILDFNRYAIKGGGK